MNKFSELLVTFDHTVRIIPDKTYEKAAEWIEPALDGVGGVAKGSIILEA